MSFSEVIKARLEDAKIRYWAGDNISEILQAGDKEKIIMMQPSSLKKCLTLY